MSHFAPENLIVRRRFNYFTWPLVRFRKRVHVYVYDLCFLLLAFLGASPSRFLVLWISCSTGGLLLTGIVLM